MNNPNHARWVQLCRASGLIVDTAVCFDKLSAAYSEPQRHYHNFHHIAECLREFDTAQSLVANPVAVELAIWFHDGVYDPRAGDNEEKSAALAKEFLTQYGATESLVQSTEKLVLATKSHVAFDNDSKILLDVDLSILGQSNKRFAEYEQQIRAEYSWVPVSTFLAKRAEILENFLKRDRIYQTEFFFKKYEQSARLNLQQSIAALRA